MDKDVIMVSNPVYQEPERNEETDWCALCCCCLAFEFLATMF